jgi:hypothetical protein
MSTLTALEILMQLLNQAAAFGTLIAKARSENRDITEDELNTLAISDDAARDALNKAIADAKART